MKNWLHALALTAALGFLSLHGWLGSYTRFIADDFCSAYLGQRLGLLRYIWFWYNQWGGRYTAIGADMLLAWLNPRQIGILPPLGLALWLGLLALLFRLRHPSADRQSVAGAAVFSLFALLLLTPNPAQSIYWFSAYRTHTLPLLVFSVYLLLALRLTQTAQFRPWHPLAGFAFALFNGGFSESFTLLQAAALASFWLWHYRQNHSPTRRQSLFFYVASLTAAGIAFLLMFTAPGNANRQESFRQLSGLGELLEISFSGYSAFLLSLLNSPAKIAALLGIWLFFGSLPAPKNAPHALLWLAWGFSLAFASFPPAAYGMADTLPERAHTIPLFFLLLALSQAAPRLAPPPHSRAAAGALILLAAALSLPALAQSQPVYASYAQRADSAEAQILQAKAQGAEQVQIPPLRNWAGTFDPTDNPNFFSTYCISKYYGIQVYGQPLPEE